MSASDWSSQYQCLGSLVVIVQEDWRPNWAPSFDGIETVPTRKEVRYCEGWRNHDGHHWVTMEDGRPYVFENRDSYFRP